MEMVLARQRSVRPDAPWCSMLHLRITRQYYYGDMHLRPFANT